jgi:hypothetical protein
MSLSKSKNKSTRKRSGQKSTRKRSGQKSTRKKSGQKSTIKRSGRKSTRKRSGRKSTRKRSGRKSFGKRSGRKSTRKRSGRKSFGKRSERKSTRKRSGRNDGGKFIIREYDIKKLPYKKRINFKYPNPKKHIIYRFNKEKIKDIVLYRCLRTDELPNILTTGLLPPCTPCPEKVECCNISSGAHINSGTKAKVKSRYISASKKESVGHWCSNTSGNPTNKKSATYVKFSVKYDGINVLNPQTDIVLGIMAKNAAKASSEILIKDNVPASKLLEIYRIKNISKKLYDELPDNFIDSKSGMEFKKIKGKGKQNKITYHLRMKIWSSTKNILFDINNGVWP